jgi:hypothetical protein
MNHGMRADVFRPRLFTAYDESDGSRVQVRVFDQSVMEGAHSARADVESSVVHRDVLYRRMRR